MVIARREVAVRKVRMAFADRAMGGVPALPRAGRNRGQRLV